MQKLAICLQVWNGDIWIGMRLMRLICSIEPKKRADIEFILSAKRETNKPAIKQILEIAKEKFASVQFIQGKRFGEGWPSSCNDLWAETMMRVSQMRENGKIKSSGVLTFEADCLPLRPDWLDELAEAWRLARTGEQGRKFVCGHAHGEPPTHINGNAIFDCAVTDQYPELNGSCATAGWDAFHGDLLLSIGLDTWAIYQKYRIKEITRDEVEAIRKHGKIPAMFHGVKGLTGLLAVESMVADGYFFNRA